MCAKLIVGLLANQIDSSAQQSNFGLVSGFAKVKEKKTSKNTERHSNSEPL
jgi:hypothetical protein